MQMSCKQFFLRSAIPTARSLYLRPATMPLRAKITNPAMAMTRTFASEADIPRELPDDEKDDVLFHSSYGVRSIELNRPKKLNSLNGSMARKIIPRLIEYGKSDMANIIIMKGAGEKALCAGGDVAALAKWNQEGKEGQAKSTDYFGTEYKLDHLIATYPKPYIAFMDGITMGGGVGLSVHAPFRIATERTVFAMPETTIGFFPEVGGSFFLPRMDGALGTYLSLTSERLQGVNVFYHGVATHYLHSSSLPDLENRLAELNFKDYTDMQERCKIINSTIEEFVTGLPHDVPMALTGDTRKAIDKSFSHDDINSILATLKEYEKDDQLSEWAQKTAKTIKERSPTSVKVTLKQMQLGKNWSIDETFEREYNIAAVFMAHHDFVEGVSARLMKKPPEKPVWEPATLDDVSWDDVDIFFAPPKGLERLKLLAYGKDTAYKQYPHAWIGLPREEEIRTFVQESKAKSTDQVIDHFVQAKDGKEGVKEKVLEVLKRKTSKKDGALVWEQDQTPAASHGSKDPSSSR